MCILLVLFPSFVHPFPFVWGSDSAAVLPVPEGNCCQLSFLPLLPSFTGRLGVDSCSCTAVFFVAGLMCLVCSSFSFTEKVWECLNPVENLFILAYCWNYCPSGRFWSSGEGSGLIAGKGKAIWFLQMMVIHDACGAGAKWETSTKCFREYPNAWNSSGKVGPPSVHNQLCRPLLLWNSKSLVPGWKKLSIGLDPPDPGGAV